MFATTLRHITLFMYRELHRLLYCTEKPSYLYSYYYSSLQDDFALQNMYYIMPMNAVNFCLHLDQLPSQPSVQTVLPSHRRETTLLPSLWFLQLCLSSKAQCVRSTQECLYLRIGAESDLQGGTEGSEQCWLRQCCQTGHTSWVLIYTLPDIPIIHQQASLDDIIAQVTVMAILTTQHNKALHS